MGHLLADDAVAASCRRLENALFVGEHDLEPVNFQLTSVGWAGASRQTLPDALVEGADILLGKGVIERPLRHRMAHLFELREGFARNPLGWGIGGYEGGVLLFELRELVLQRIERLGG